MQSKAIDVDTHLNEVPDARRQALTKIRELCLKELKDYTEAMMYGGPCYVKNNTPEAGFASQKHLIGLYILKKDLLDKYREVLKAKGIGIGKGCIRYSKPDKINFEVVEKLLKGTFTSTGTICH